MGLGLGDSLGGNQNDYSFLSQLKEHGLIDKKIFSVYTQMRNETANPSQIRFGSHNEDLFKGIKDKQLHWINTLNDKTWQIKMAQIDF